MRWPRYQFQIRTLLILTAVIAGGLVVARWPRHAPKGAGSAPGRVTVGTGVPGWLVPRLKHDGSPLDRLQYFAWLGGSSAKVRIVGWQTWLVSETSAAGARVVGIGVRPELRGDGVPFTPNTYCEYYEYRQGKIHYLGGKSLSKGQVLFVD